MAQAVQPQESVVPPTEAPLPRVRFEWRWTDVFWILGIILLVVGAPGMWQRLTEGLAPTNLTSYVPWGVWVGFYDYLVWMEVGSLLIFTSMIYIFGDRLMPKIKPIVLFTGFTIVTMGLLIVLLDLGHFERFWHVIVYPDFGSMIAWMVWLHSSYLLILTLELAIVLWGGDRFKSFLKPLAYISLPVGLALIIVSGSIFGVVAARPLWNTASLPLMFLLSALAAGSGLLLFLIVVFWQNKQSDEYVRLVKRVSVITRTLLLAGVFAAGVIAFTMLYKGGGNPTRAEALNLILTGPYWWSFWIVHILLGVLIPLGILFTMPSKPVMAGIAAFLSSVTFVAVTLNIVIPTLVTEELKGLATAFVDPKLSLDYAPNLMEWMVLFFIFGIGAVIFGLGMRFLPLQSHHAEESHE
ncbi:NrfD/PsrC family molybdoenzyme membrane anchor subunit [Aggregatilineales bacterium SYSU G02658]